MISRTEEIIHNFSYHKPDADKASKHEQIRLALKNAALFIQDNVPDCREKSLAITKLEEAMLWANAGLARN